MSSTATREITATARPWRTDYFEHEENFTHKRGYFIAPTNGYDIGHLPITASVDREQQRVNAELIVEAVNAHASLVAEVGRLRGATEAALSLLRRFRDEKPKQWDAIVDADACDVWDSLVAALRSGGE